MFIFTNLPAWLILFLQERCMDANEEQSRHGDEVMSLLSYKDEKHTSGQERQKKHNH